MNRAATQGRSTAPLHSLCSCNGSAQDDNWGSADSVRAYSAADLAVLVWEIAPGLLLRGRDGSHAGLHQLHNLVQRKRPNLVGFRLRTRDGSC